MTPKICATCGGNNPGPLYFACYCQPPSGKGCERCHKEICDMTHFSYCPYGKCHVKYGCVPAPTTEGEKGMTLCQFDGNPLPCEHPQWELDYHKLMSKCLWDWDMLGAHGFDDPIVEFIRSQLAKERSLAAEEMLGKAIGVVEERGKENLHNIPVDDQYPLGPSEPCTCCYGTYNEILDRLRDLQDKNG